MRGIKLLLIVLLILSCAKISEEERMRRAQEHYKEGLKEFKEKDYSGATWEFNEALKYMDYLTPEQLENVRFLLGKAYYLDKDYVNAVIALEDYIFYYPKGKRTQEAYYMLIDSYINVSPDAWRDQEYTWKAIEKAREFLSRFPNSPYAEKVKSLIEKAYRKIAKHEYLIAKFYEDYGYTYSAAQRYKELLINFPKYVSVQEVLYRYIKNLLLVEKQEKRVRERLQELINKEKKKLKKEKDKEVKEAIKRRIEFLESEIKRWEKLREDSFKEALKLMEEYKKVYGKTVYYKKLEKILKERYGKAKDSQESS